MVFRLKEVLEGPSCQLCPLPAPSIYFLPTLTALGCTVYSGRGLMARGRELALGGPASLPLCEIIHAQAYIHTCVIRCALALMLAFICIRRQRVADWCGAWLMIKASMKQIGLHGEMGNVTGMVWYSLSLRCRKAFMSYFGMIKSFFFYHHYPK